MKTKPRTKCTWCFFALMVSFILISCEKKNDSGLSFEFSNGTIITESDIEFYDSSTCIFFLKNELIIQNYMDESDPTICVEFTLSINEQIVYTGIIKNLSAWVPPVEYFIETCERQTFESDVLPIKPGLNAPEIDGRNDHILIDFLERNNLLYNGIKCMIDTVYKSTQNDSTILGVITIKNYDNINYYLAKPYLEEDELLNMDAGYFAMKNRSIGDYHFAEHSSYSVNWDDAYLKKLLILKGLSEVSFDFKSSIYPKMKPGIYEAEYSYRNLPCEFKYFEFELNQPMGRVWVGRTYTKLGNIIID